MLVSHHLLALSAAFSMTVLAKPNPTFPPNITITNSTTSMYQLSEDSQFAFVLSEYLALSNEGGAATGEVLRAAAGIEPQDIESFYSQFKFLADKIHDQAVQAEKSNFLVSARDAYFRASSYYRAADFFLHGNLSDPRIYTLWDQQRSDFVKAIKLLPQPGFSVELNATNFTVPAYFFPANPSLPGQSSHSSGRLPTIVAGTGYDGSQEELYHAYCRGVVERGWNCITYEGPGQPTVRRDQNLGFIPEWWEAVTPVVDYLHTRDDVDVDKVALVGVSFGGLLAPLAATREHRLAAVLAIDGMLSLQETMMQQFPSEMVELYTSGNKTGFNLYVEAVLAMTDIPTQFRWALDQGMFAWNTTDPYEWFEGVGEFYLNEEKLIKITSPVFVASGENDSTAPGQPEQMARLLGNQSHYYLFKTDVGAGEHCAIGAERQLAMRTLDWLSRIFFKAN